MSFQEPHGICQFHHSNSGARLTTWRELDNTSAQKTTKYEFEVNLPHLPPYLCKVRTYDDNLCIH